MTVSCPEISPLARVTPDELNHAFASAPALVFHQAWRGAAGAETRFHPGQVRVGWQGDELLAWAQLATSAPAGATSRANADQQWLWTLGDVFEVFVGGIRTPAYQEYQLSPTGHRLQLDYPRGVPASCMADLPPHRFFAERLRMSQWSTPTMWRVFARVVIAGAEGSLLGRQIDACFGRYDYQGNGDGEPVLSSTAPLTAPNFHLRPEWHVIVFS